MANTVSISQPHLEAFLKAVEDFEEYTAKATIASCPNNEAFQVYLATRKPVLEKLYAIKFALKFQLDPSLVEVHQKAKV